MFFFAALIFHLANPSNGHNMARFSASLPLDEWRYYRRVGRLVEMSTLWYVPCDALDEQSVATPEPNLECPDD